MDLEYFRDNIKDELCGAKMYIKNAIEIKGMAPDWCPTLIQMSAAELEHATHLYKMAKQYYSKITSQYTEIPECLSDMWDDIVDIYAEKSAKVKYLHDMYKNS